MKGVARAGLPDLVDQLPDTQTPLAARVLESLASQPSLGRRPVAALPLDEDGLSDEALRAIEEARGSHGRTDSHLGRGEARARHLTERVLPGVPDADDRYRPELGVIDLRLHPPAPDIDRSSALST